MVAPGRESEWRAVSSQPGSRVMTGGVSAHLPGYLLTAHRSLLTALALLAAGLLAACRGTLSPLSNRLKIGEESYIVFSADGEDGLSDLFASPPSGSPTFQITFT